MLYDFNLLSYIRFLLGFLAIVIAIIIWKKKIAFGAKYLAFFELAAAVWTIADGFEEAALTASLKFLWAKIAYIGVTTSPVFFLLFSLYYTWQNKFANHKTFLLLLTIPFVTFLLAVTNSYHNILWERLEINEVTHFGIYYYGWWFWIHIIYTYLTLTGGIILLLVSANRVYQPFKINIWLLVTGSILPFIASILYVFKLTPIKGLDLTPISFVFSGIIILISFYRFRMFDITPIARKQVIENLSVGILVVDSRDQIIDLNPAFKIISNLREATRIKYSLDEVLSKINIKADDFRDSNNFCIETQVYTQDEKKYYEVKYHEILGKSNELVCKIFILNDITGRKIITEEIVESNKRRKIELIEKEALIKDLNAYARSVAHDLKNPINLMVGFSELIKKNLLENNTAKAIELLDIMKDDSLKLGIIIDDLLKLSVIRKEDIQVVPIETCTIINEVRKRLEKQINDSEAILNIPSKCPKVLGHGQLIEEVWVNLFSNAIKYGGNPPEITLGYETTTPSIVTFWIRDNGNGLPENSLGKIFDDFERLGREDIEGHGLGLPIVKRIVEKLGGSVSVQSSNIPGEGCKFSFTLRSYE